MAVEETAVAGASAAAVRGLKLKGLARKMAWVGAVQVLAGSVLVACRRSKFFHTREKNDKNVDELSRRTCRRKLVMSW